MHKRRSRLMFAVAATVAATIALAGCSGGGGTTTSDGKTVVTFWQQKFEDYQQAWFKKEVTAYNKSQDKVQINLQVVPADTWTQKLKAAQAAGKQPDIATTSYGNISAGVASGAFAQLDKLMPGKDFSDIKDNVKSFVTIDGKHYAYPMLVEPSTVLYYRTDLVKAAGLDPDKPPTTWADLIEWAKKLTAGNVYGMNIAQTAPDLAWSSWGLQYNSCGHLPVSDDWSKAQATDSCFSDLAKFYQTLYTQKLMPQEATVGYADATPYGQGKVAMTAGGSWVVGQLKTDFKDMVAKTAVAPFPSKDGDPTSTTATLGGWTLTVDGKSKNKQGAADFIHYLLAGDPKIMSDFFAKSGYSKYTVRNSVDKELASDPQANADPFMKIISDKIVPYGKQEPSYPYDIALDFGTGIEKAMKGGNVSGALSEANTAMQDVITKQSLAGTGPGSK